MENPELNALRDQINTVDEKLVQLLEQRFAIVKKVGVVKQAAKLPIRDEKREQAVLNRLKAKVDDEALQPAIQAIFQTIMDEAKKLE
ncbi:chorismate mutase [Limosilactobacillus mucosae]|uniref:chorismate mutase n=1 Tax=Limosilactobacillus mucosae TaxID=97478 RepID=UPI00233F355D|nr:chorismate mutase [Limosilactobacillus mucosae]MDC2840034.1 chorismate mutase [Limosilactobacillus mucosae]MDC2845944.1 chorismate mutase [Limosilactobacillus mucosae]